MWTADIQDGNVTVSSTTTGKIQSQKPYLFAYVSLANNPLSSIKHHYFTIIVSRNFPMFLTLKFTNYVPGTSSGDHKRPLDLSVNEAKQPLPNIFTSTSDNSADKRLKTTSCEIHGKKHQKSNKLLKETISKWQLCNLAKCVFENTVNQMLEGLSDHSITSRQDFNIENEAVLMAIEEHGLRQPSIQCSCPESPTESDSFCCSTNDFYEPITPSTSTNTYYPNEESQEFNFENNFLATAVSAAIEEKGLSMYHV